MSLKQERDKSVANLKAVTLFNEVANEILAAIEERAMVEDVDTNVPRLVLQETPLLEKLFDTVEGIGKKQSDSDDGDVKTANERSFSWLGFRDAIVGDGEERSCAKVLATLLRVRVGLDTTTWQQFVEGLHRQQSEDRLLEFGDIQMPFERTQIIQHFGTEHVDAIETEQHTFCPIDLNSKFTQLREKLVELFDNVQVCDNVRDHEGDSNKSNTGFLVKCKVDDGDNKNHTDPVSVFFPNSALVQVAESEKDCITNLYVEAIKAQNRVRRGSNPFTQWRELERYKRQADGFYIGVRSRMKILGTLMLITVEPTSKMWKNFASDCLHNNHNTSTLMDGLLPLSPEAVERHFGSVRRTNEAFCNMQHRFCAVKLQKRTQVHVPWNRHDQRLPLLEKHYVDRGSFGHVFRVIVKAEYSYTSRDEELAMKEMVLSSDHETEWGTAQWLFDQEIKHKCILQAVASIKMSDGLYIFFPLAICNLRHYMRGEEEFCNRSGPKTFEERKRLFNLFVGLGQALKYLHFDLQDKDRHRMICIHGDLKTENILVVDRADRERRFQITDFGISSIKCQRQHHPGETGTVSLTHRTTRTKLDNQRPNFPPEANKDGVVDASMDVWAFGVAFAEFVAWLSGGAQALEAFEKARGGSGDDQLSGYYLSWEVQTNNGVDKTVLREGIRSWFTSLLDKTDDVRENRLYQHSWRLLEHRLLLCDQTKRANMEQVVEDLGRILNDESPFAHVSDDAPNHTNLPLLRQSNTVPSSRLKSRNTLKHQTSGRRSSADQARPMHQSNGILRWVPEWWNTRKDESMKSRQTRTAARVRSDRSLATHYAPNAITHQRPAVRASEASETMPAPKESNLRRKLEKQIDACKDDEAAQLLRDGAEWLTLDSEGRSCLHRASQNGLPRTVRFMLEELRTQNPGRESLSKIVNAKDPRTGSTPLIYAVKENQEEVAQLLIDNGADVDVKDVSQWTTLHYAVKGPGVDLVKALLDKSPALVLQPNSDGHTPLHICAKSGNKMSLVHTKELLQKVPHAANVRDSMSKKYPIFYATNKSYSTETNGSAKVEELLKCMPEHIADSEFGHYWPGRTTQHS